MAELKQLLSYTVGDEEYQNYSLKTIIGEMFDTPDALEKLKRTPVDSGIPFPAEQTLAQNAGGEGKSDPPPASVPLSQDHSFCSYNYGSDVRGFKISVVTNTDNPGSMSYDTTVSLLALPRSAGSFWSTLARNITVLASDGGYALTNPRGLAGLSGRLYLANFDDKRIYTIGKNELNGLPDGSSYNLKTPAFDLKSEAGLLGDYKGQALFPVNEGGQKYLNALLIKPNFVQEDYDPSVLVRLAVNDEGVLSYKDQTFVAPNAQGLALARDRAGVTRLLACAIGGWQIADATNGINSCVSSVPALGSWPSDAYVHLTGDTWAAGSTPVVFDIRSVDIAYRGRPDDIVVIFTGIYHGVEYTNFSYAVFVTTAGELLAMNGLSISEAAASGKLRYAFGVTNAPGADLWDICIAMGGTPDEDVLWLRGGEEIHAMLVKGLGKPDARDIVYGSGLGPCKIGGWRVNSIDVTSETQRQALAGLGKKRTLCGTPPEVRTEAGKNGK
jgi:hypothetical protein